jgi:hypothetical protein
MLPMLPPLTLTIAPLALCLLLQETAPAAPWFASLGVGGVLAGGMFLYYRSDRKESARQARRDAEQADRRYAELAQNFRTLVQENTRAIESNTATARETLGAIHGLREALILRKAAGAGDGD